MSHQTIFYVYQNIVLHQPEICELPVIEFVTCTTVFSVYHKEDLYQVNYDTGPFLIILINICTAYADEKYYL